MILTVPKGATTRVSLALEVYHAALCSAAEPGYDRRAAESVLGNDVGGRFVTARGWCTRSVTITGWWWW